MKQPSEADPDSPSKGLASLPDISPLVRATTRSSHIALLASAPLQDGVVNMFRDPAGWHECAESACRKSRIRWARLKQAFLVTAVDFSQDVGEFHNLLTQDT